MVKLKVIVICIWSFSLVYNIFYALYMEIFQKPGARGYGFCILYWRQQWSWYLYYESASVVLFFIIPPILMLYFHAKIITRISKRDRILHDKIYKKAKCAFKCHFKGMIKSDSISNKLKKSKSLMNIAHLKEAMLIRVTPKKSYSFSSGISSSSNSSVSVKSAVESKCTYAPHLKVITKTKNHKTKIIKLLVIIVFCFVFNSFQFTAISLYSMLSSWSQFKPYLVAISQIFYFSNSAINCFLYALYSKKFCQCAKHEFPTYAKIMDKIRCRK